MTLHDSTLTHAGRAFRVRLLADDDSQDAPWEREDGHGPVRRVFGGTRANPHKRPGEHVLTSDGRGHWLYDWQEATRIARRDGWGIDDETRAQLTRRHGREFPNATEAAVQADYDRMRGWLRGDWAYIGVEVELLDSEGDGTGETESLWGIESDSPEYHAEVARELAEQILQPRAKAWREALTVAREAHALRKLAAVQAAVLRG